MLAQVETLRKRVLSSGGVLSPAPVFAGDPSYVVKMPSREYVRSVYDGALGTERFSVSTPRSDARSAPTTPNSTT